MSTLLVNQINPVSGNTLTLSGSNIIIPGNLTITGNLSGSLTGSVTSASYALTASYVLGGGSTTSTSSLLTTASISGQTLTFTKGDASTFDVTIPSGGSINTGSFATTGSNTFTGNQIVTGSLNVKGDVNLSGSKQFGIEADTSKTFIKSTGVFINENETIAKATLSPGVLDVTGRPGAAEVVLRNNNDLDDTIFDAGQISFYGPSDSNAYGGVQGKIQARVDSGSGAVASYLEFYTAGDGGFPFDSSDIDMRISTGSSIELFRNTTINGSLKQGRLVTSSGNFSHAEGYKSQAVGQYSHAEGGGPAGTFTEQLGGRATGTGSHAEGSFTLALGSFSHAEGQFTTASAPWSHAEGLGTIANGWYQHVQGAYNTPSSAESAFIIGNGVADEARSNLLFASGELVQVTGSVRITSVLTLTPNDPLPAGQPTGSIAVSGSGVDCKPYFWNGATWTSMI